MPPLILVPSLADQRPTNEVPIGEVARHRRVIARPDTTDDVVVAVQLDFATIVMHDSSPVFHLNQWNRTLSVVQPMLDASLDWLISYPFLHP